MKFDHMVNFRGVYYKAGEEVPVPNEVKEEVKKPVEEAPEPTTMERRRGRPPRREN